jgi:outer membrane protein OmpA-like peptidoglycan-associated protein
LHKKGDPNIHLIGHTDPVGADGSNLLLSKGRAATVRKYLEKRGYKGNIVSTGKGERNPLYDPRGNAIRHYGKKRWYRMLRRVEIVIY